MKQRIVDTLYAVRDGATSILRRITGGWRDNASAAEQASARIEAANQRQSRSANSVLASIGRIRFAYFAIAGAVTAAVSSVAKFARAASNQETAEARLETALRNGAGATEEQLDALQRLSEERQRVTRFGDEQTLSAQAQLATFRLTADQIALLTPRVQDLAEASRRLGKDQVDLEQSAILVGKALTGNVGSLSRYGVVLTDTQKEQIRFGDENERIAALVEALDSNFAGLSESLPPFEQAIQSASNGLGDFGEKLGQAITQSPEVIALIEALTNRFSGFGQSLEENSGGIQRFVTGTISAFRILGNTATITFNAILLGANRISSRVLETVQTIARNLARVSFGSARESLEQFVETADQRLAELEESSNRRFEAIGKDAADFLDAGRKLTDSITGQAKAQKELNDQTEKSTKAAADSIQADTERRESLDLTTAALERLGIGLDEAQTGIRDASRQAIADLTTLAISGEVNLDVLGNAAKRVGDAFNEFEAAALRDELNSLFATGRIGVQEFEALRRGLSKLKDEGSQTAGIIDQLNDSIETVDDFQGIGRIAQQIREMGKAGILSAAQVQALNEALQKQIALLGQNDNQNQQNIDSTQQLGNEIEVVGEKAGEAEESFGGFGAAVAKILAGWRDLSDSAAQAVDDFVRQTGMGVRTAQGFFARLADFTKNLADEQARQVAAADAVIERVEAAGDATAGASQAVDLLQSEIQLLDQQRLDRLTSIVEQSRRQWEGFLESVSDRSKSLNEEYLRLIGSTEELAALQDAERKKAIQDDLRRAQISGDSGLVKQLREDLALLEKINEQRDKNREQEAQQRREQQRQRENASTSTQGSQSQSAGIGFQPVETIRLNLEGLGDLDFPTSQRDTMYGLLELLRRSGKNTLPRISP